MDYGNDFLLCSYVLWKVAAGAAPTPEQRTALCTAAGVRLLQQIAPDIQQQLHKQAAAGKTGRTAFELMHVSAPRPLFLRFLLFSSNKQPYICRITFNKHGVAPHPMLDLGAALQDLIVCNTMLQWKRHCWPFIFFLYTCNFTTSFLSCSYACVVACTWR